MQTRRGTTLVHRLLTKPAFEGAGTPLRDDGRSRRSLTVSRSVRGSETIFPKAFRIPFHLPGLSVPYRFAYSSLHCLCMFDCYH